MIPPNSRRFGVGSRLWRTGGTNTKETSAFHGSFQVLAAVKVCVLVKFTLNIVFGVGITFLEKMIRLTFFSRFLRGNRALEEIVAPRPLEMTTFYNVSGLPPQSPTLTEMYCFWWISHFAPESPFVRQRPQNT